MDEPLPANQCDQPLESPDDSFAAARQRARAILAAQRQRLQQMESGLEKQIEAIAEDLARDHQEVHSERDELQRNLALLQRQREQLSTDQQEWEQAQESAHREQRAAVEHLRQQQHELQRREREATEREAQWRKSQRTFETLQQEVAEEAAELSRSKRRLEEKQRAIDEEREQLAQDQAETSNQRRRIAQRLQQQRADLQADLDRQQAEIKRLGQRDHQQLAEQAAQLERAQEDLAAARAQARQLQNELARQLAEQTQLRTELDQARAQQQHSQAELSALRERFSQLDAEHVELAAALKTRDSTLAARDAALAGATVEGQQLETLQRKFDMALDDARELKRRNAELQEELATRPVASGNEPQLATLMVERDGLLERLAEAEARAKRSVGDSAEQRKFQELQRRFELAVEDVRELKNRNSELEAELTAAQQQQRTTPHVASGGKLDWEAQKRQLLASLEADFDQDDAGDRRERLSIQGTIDITDEVVANKDREIAELKRQVQQQGVNSRAQDASAAAVAEVLDHDQLILQERQRLAELQTEWESKLRQAEIDVSLERAKLGRERAAIEEKQQELQAKLGQVEGNGQASASNNGQPNKFGRGRWLARAGL